MIELKDVTLNFNGIIALDSLDLTIQPNTIHAIIGPNGAGKTTLFNCLSCFYQPTKGEIFVNGQTLKHKKPHQIARFGIARSFQNVELCKDLTVEDNLLIGAYNSLNKNLFQTLFLRKKVAKANIEITQKAHDVLAFLGIADKKYEVVKNLSFGNQKLVDIARSIMSDTKIILMDEPVAGMNEVESQTIIKLIHRLKEELGYTVLIIEHDMKMIMSISDCITVLNFGKKIAEGTPEQVQYDERVIEAYLGQKEAELC